ncbi:MAG: helix-turn-helix transcriptional regulator, partial [Clostridia bacterium]|nr:helix-turn-helix transcriptional regulator [Clostridia bacterium]
MYAILQYIREHIEDKLTLDTISEIFGYSKWHLCRRFHDEMHIPLTEYIRSIRIQLSAQALAEGDKVIHVANRFGYDTVSGFNKAFLKEYGCYPQNYKKEYIQCQHQYEERRKNMYPISDRAAMLREAAIANKYSDLIFAQRDYWFYKGILTCPD